MNGADRVGKRTFSGSLAVTPSKRKHSMRPSVLFGFLAVLLLQSRVPAQPPPALRVSENGRFLVTVDGRPFFRLGDTAWRFIEKASRVDVDDQQSALRYLEKHSAQGFNVIQTVLVHVDIPANAAETGTRRPC